MILSLLTKPGLEKNWKSTIMCSWCPHFPLSQGSFDIRTVDFSDCSFFSFLRVYVLLFDCGHKTFESVFCTHTPKSTNQNAGYHVSNMIFVLRALSKVLWLQPLVSLFFTHCAVSLFSTYEFECPFDYFRLSLTECRFAWWVILTNQEHRRNRSRSF